jgi:hypothetical protein
MAAGTPEGSWRCGGCANVNWPARTTCNRKNCGLPRGMATATMALGAPPGMAPAHVSFQAHPSPPPGALFPAAGIMGATQPTHPGLVGYGAYPYHAAAAWTQVCGPTCGGPCVGFWRQYPRR